MRTRRVYSFLIRLLPAVLALLLVSCQTFPRGELLEEMNVVPDADLMEADLMDADGDASAGDSAGRPQAPTQPTNEPTDVDFFSEMWIFSPRPNPQTNEPTNEPTDVDFFSETKSTNKQTNQQANQQTNEQTNNLTNQPTNQLTNNPTNKPTTLEYSLADLYRYFTMCRAVWKVRDNYKGTDWELDYFSHEASNTLGMTVTENGVLHVLFRSTQAPENKTDLKYNSRILLRESEILPEPGMRAHQGFLEKYAGVRREVLERVEAFDGRRVQLVGHSAGGAMAAIAFADIKTQYPELELRAVTFGMVRVFNRRGAEWFQEYQDDFLRIVNGRDPFPNLPPAIFGYRHVGRLIRIGSRPLYKIFSAEDHYHGYRKELEALLIQEGIDPSDYY